MQQIETLKLLKKLISTDKVDTAALQQMLKQEKENNKELEDKYHRILEEKRNQIEAQKNKVFQIQQDLKDAKSEMKRNHKECKETLLEYYERALQTHQDPASNQFQRAAAANNESRHHRIETTSDVQIVNLTQGDETIVQDIQATPPNYFSVPASTVPANLTVLQEPVRSVTENLYSSTKPHIPLKNQQESKNQSTTKMTALPKFQNNRSDETLPCFLVGRLQEEKMDKFLKRIQIHKPVQPKQTESTVVQKQQIAPPKEAAVKQNDELPQAKPNLNADITPASTFFQLPESWQETLVNQSIMDQSSRSIVKQSVVNQSIVDQSLHIDELPNTDTVLTSFIQQEDENFGMKSKADDFFEDSEEEEGEISLDGIEEAQHSQNSSQNETANEELREKLLEVFDSDDILRLTKRVLKSDITDLIEFLERNRNELTFTTKRCKASHIALPTSPTELLIISCLSDQAGNLDDGYEKAVSAIKSDDFNFERLCFVIE